MAYNHGKEERKWRIWKDNEEKVLRKCRGTLQRKSRKSYT